MAKRPIFAPLFEGKAYVLESYVDFQWHAGMSLKQKQRSIAELHNEARVKFKLQNPLEISSKSDNQLGVALSSFNLQFTTEKGRTYTVESAFQASKVFKNGGPYLDILNKTPKEAKKDTRLRDSGDLLYFYFFGQNWDILPRTAFYDWLYINALLKNPQHCSVVEKFDYFTDIEFNPERSVNCQARSLALFIALSKRGRLASAIESQEAFLAMHRESVPEPRFHQTSRLI